MALAGERFAWYTLTDPQVSLPDPPTDTVPTWGGPHAYRAHETTPYLGSRRSDYRHVASDGPRRSRFRHRGRDYRNASHPQWTWHQLRHRRPHVCGRHLERARGPNERLLSHRAGWNRRVGISRLYLHHAEPLDRI